MTPAPSRRAGTRRRGPRTCPGRAWRSPRTSCPSPGSGSRPGARSSRSARRRGACGRSRRRCPGSSPGSAAWKSCWPPRRMSMATGALRSRASSTRSEPSAQASSWVKLRQDQAALLLLQSPSMSGAAGAVTGAQPPHRSRAERRAASRTSSAAAASLRGDRVRRRRRAGRRRRPRSTRGSRRAASVAARPPPVSGDSPEPTRPHSDSGSTPQRLAGRRDARPRAARPPAGRGRTSRSPPASRARGSAGRAGRRSRETYRWERTPFAWVIAMKVSSSASAPGRRTSDSA